MKERLIIPVVVKNIEPDYTEVELYQYSDLPPGLEHVPNGPQDQEEGWKSGYLNTRRLKRAGVKWSRDSFELVFNLNRPNDRGKIVNIRHESDDDRKAAVDAIMAGLDRDKIRKVFGPHP